MTAALRYPYLHACAVGLTDLNAVVVEINKEIDELNLEIRKLGDYVNIGERWALYQDGHNLSGGFRANYLARFTFNYIAPGELDGN